jgi:hypothetical protein
VSVLSYGLLLSLLCDECVNDVRASIQGGRVVYKGGKYGQGSGEGETYGLAPLHHVTIHDRRNDQVVDLKVPEDRYVHFLCL